MIVLLFLALAATANFTTELSVFGPKTYVRQTGRPVPVTTTFQADESSPAFTLRVANSGVTSAVIALNGQNYLFPGDFRGSKKDGAVLYRNVTLAAGDNTLSVDLRGKPGTSLTLTILAAALRNRPPVANAGPDQTVAVRQVVELTGAASSDADGNHLTYLWSFASRPAGSSATLVNPSDVMPAFVPDVPGAYVISLVVNDGTEPSAPDTVTVSTVNSSPIANAGPDQTAPVGTPITLDASRSSDVDSDALTYLWKFESVPSGSAAVLSDETAVNPAFTIDEPGAYVLQLVVHDGRVASAPDTVVVTTTNSSPVANAGADQSAFVTALITLDASGSTDVDGDSLTYSWSLASIPTGSLAVLNNASAIIATFVVDRPGTYVAQVIVHDGTVASSPDTVTITTLNSAPVADAGVDQTALTGTTVTLSGSGSTDVDGDPLTYQWSLVSVPPGSTANLATPTSPTPSFIVDLPGTYVAQLVVHDGALSSAPDTVVINTTNSAPVANAGADQIGVPVGAVVTLDGAGSNDPDRDALAFDWSLIARPPTSSARISNAAIAQPTFTPDVVGEYVAQLIVSDGVVSSAPDTVLIRTNRPPVVRAGPDFQVPLNRDSMLIGQVEDDHFPAGAPLTISWSQVSGPGMAIFEGDRSHPATFVAFTAVGAYTLRLTANDSNLTAFDDVVVTVVPP